MIRSLGVSKLKVRPITIEALKRKNKQFSSSASIDFYISSVLDQQQDKYGLTSKKEKRQQSIDRDNEICHKLEQRT